MKSTIESPRGLFELFTRDGHTCKIYEDGHYTGFPEGTCIINCARPYIGALTGKIHRLEQALAKAEEHIANHQRSGA